MNAPIQRVRVGAAIIAVAATAVPSLAQAPADTRPPCVRSQVALDETIDSARAKPGDTFTFRLASAATASDGTALPAGTLGYGVIANASHAQRGGQPGYLALETRFLVLDGGRHVPAIIDRVTDQVSTAVGASANAPGVLGLIPIVGYAVGGYDALHHGRDAAIPRGARVQVFIGDDVAQGTCRQPAAGETPAPAPAPSASPASSPNVTPTASPSG